MKYRLEAISIYELGQRANQEDNLYPPFFEKSAGADLFILCDGMGGHAAGEVASQTVCESMSQYIISHPREDGYFEESDFMSALDAAYDALDERDTNDVKKMGTTLTFVKFHEGGCFVAHIGDSRVYHIRPSEHKVLFVTRDHSLVNDLVDLGELTPEEAKSSSQKNVISRAMQPNQERRTKADWVNLTDIRPGDFIYMCSDGMLENMEDEQIVNILSAKDSMKRKKEILIGATRENRDNHSAHLIHVLSVRGNNTEPISPEQVDETKTDAPLRTPKRYWWSVIILVLLLAVIAFFFYRH